MIKRYKENPNLVILSSKVITVNDIISTLNTSRSNALVPPKVQPVPPIKSIVSKVLVRALAFDKMFLTKFDPLK